MSEEEFVDANEKVTADKVVHALAKRYCEPAFALFQNVANGTGWTRKKTRYADAVAMSLWPSRGLDVTGLEVKVSRSDWKRELADPEKADEIMSRCDYWYVVAPKGVVDVSEVPGTWGFMELRGAVLHTVKAAPKLDAKPLDRAFVAALLRRASEGMVPKASIAEEIAAARESGKAEAKLDHDYAVRRGVEALKTVAAFEEISGLRLSDYSVHGIAKAVKFIGEFEKLDFLDWLVGMRNTAACMVARAEEAIADVKARTPAEALGVLDKTMELNP